MILELKIKNYLSFKYEVTFSFEATADKTLDDYYVVEKADGTRILKMMMVYGANASGKSNLINAFEFVSSFIHSIPEDKDEETGFVPYKFSDSISESGEFNLLFYVGEKKYRYHLILTESVVVSENLYYYPGTQPATVFKRDFNANTKTSELEFGNKIKISKQATEAVQLKTLNNTSVFAAYNQVNISIPEFELVVEWFKDQYMGSINPYTSLTSFSDSAIKNDANIKKQALQFLKEADFNITDVLFEEQVNIVPEEIKLFEHTVIQHGKENKYLLDEESISKATLFFYTLSVPYLLTIERNAFLSIDNLEVGLHEHLVEHLIREFLKKSESAQLLFTTQMATILNHRDILRKDVIWFSEIKESGASELYSLSDFNFRKELSFFNAYNLGKFGAVPELT